MTHQHLIHPFSLVLWLPPCLLRYGITCHTRPYSCIAYSYSRGPNGDKGAEDRHAPHVGIAILQRHVDINADADNGRGQQPRGVVRQQQVVQPHLLAEIVLRKKTAM